MLPKYDLVMGDDGWRAAGETAAAAGVEIVVATTADHVRAATAIFSQVWPRPSGDDPVPNELVVALAHAGNYVATARRDGRAVGACLAFRGADATGDLLHSHMTGVVPGLEGRHVGLALKLHQRAWTLQRGIDRITWTFDPLVARNAYFNVSKLGADVTEFLIDFYGPLGDAVNQGSPTDRCLVTWRLRQQSRPRGVGDAPVILGPGSDGRPRIAPRQSDVGVCQVPVDIVALRRDDPAAAQAWRLALREVFTDLFAAGLRVSAVSRDGRYLFERP
jgi:predicted GNAT superfamily acetyltransferase